ncbi:MAG: response regulator [Pseudobutyrivibrio sp.]|nr:response regulator [Pseudobutyrivibrio sp.]
MEKNKLLILGEKESFIIRVLLNKLKDAGIDAVFTTPELAKINAHWEEVYLITFYMEKDEDLSDEVKTFLIDRMEDDDLQLILIGETVDTNRMKKDIPASLIHKVMPRPLDYDAYIDCVSTFSQKAASGDLKKSLLIIDDDPNYMSLVREWLKDSYKVSMATSGMRGIKWLASNTVDLILLDYEMPVTDGPQVLEMLRQDDETAKIPVFFLTGRDDKESVVKVLDLKPDGYILKTVTRDELLNKLKLFFIPKE